MSRVRSFVPALVIATGLCGGTAAAVDAPPPVSYPRAASAQTYHGLAMDTCAAPSLAAMAAWRSSPYRGVGAYIGGSSRTCPQDNLTRGWVSRVTSLGWRILPIYKGLQPPCGARPQDPKISRDPGTARGQGRNAASDAVAQATALGMLPGSALYNDIEHYSTTDNGCRLAVLNYVSGWTQRLHQRGYVSGVYANLSSGARHLSAVYSSASYARPDALWIARWDGNPSLKAWAGISDSKWSNVQRAKQYLGDHVETHGGVSINIDSDSVRAPVAAVARSYRVTSSLPLNGRSGPTTSSPVVETHPVRGALPVVCQTPGSKVRTTAVWDKLTTGAYVTDFYVSTPSKTTYSKGVPRCRYPYQVTSPTGVNKRSGPGVSYPVVASFAPGALAWVTCQRPGSRVGTTRVWDHLVAGGYVTDYYVATPSTTTYSSPLPRC